jgi:hypothetical protein
MCVPKPTKIPLREVSGDGVQKLPPSDFRFWRLAQNAHKIIPACLPKRRDDILKVSWNGLKSGGVLPTEILHRLNKPVFLIREPKKFPRTYDCRL